MGGVGVQFRGRWIDFSSQLISKKNPRKMSNSTRLVEFSSQLDSTKKSRKKSNLSLTQLVEFSTRSTPSSLVLPTNEEFHYYPYHMTYAMHGIGVIVRNTSFWWSRLELTRPSLMHISLIVLILFVQFPFVQHEKALSLSLA